MRGVPKAMKMAVEHSFFVLPCFTASFYPPNVDLNAATHLTNLAVVRRKLLKDTGDPKRRF
ncbi:hypothetical protein BSK66_16085 [Paenibacillus odorifer]|nr:hypothetical protein BJP49_12980 [Paenibacillus odorifer]OMD02769.1 hypothetical protein BJP46_15060 [Paenibacillus odorifer]OMD19101.1 hypothetical protein BJP50_12480 [Paenibacillus odorifer]OME56363.1 hypothetical protein BSK66_16085 [Paenibacillus odorifer]OZQ68372.1 hypothetical protein CA596_25775 [Paenibacillus odorifer]